MALAARLPALDLFLSDAAEEVLPIYGMRIEDLRPRFGAGFRDPTVPARAHFRVAFVACFRESFAIHVGDAHEV